MADFENKNGITDELINEILANVKLIKAITDSSKDELLTLYIKAVCNNILIKIHRRVFPEQLKYVVTDLVIDKMFGEQSSEELKSIQSMSEFDRSVNFGVSDDILARLNIIAKKQVEENMHLIFEFRLPYKT